MFIYRGCLRLYENGASRGGRYESPIEFECLVHGEKKMAKTENDEKMVYKQKMKKGNEIKCR